MSQASRLRFVVTMIYTQHVLLPLEILKCLLLDRCSPFTLTCRLCRVARVHALRRYDLGSDCRFA